MIVLVLGIAVVAAVVRAGDDDGDLAQTGPDTTTTSTSAPSTTAPTATSAPSGVPPTSAPSPTSAPPATTRAPSGAGGSGLAEGGAGEVAMGPEIPDTGIGSALAPGVALIGAGVGLRALLVGRRRHDGDGR